MNTYQAVLVTGIAAFTAGPALAHDEIAIGRTSANQLALHVHVPMPFILTESIFPDLPGWTHFEPAIISNPTDDPAEDLFTLAPDSNIRMILVGTDPEASLLSDDGSHWMTPGESYQIGSPFFHIHPIWNLSPGAGQGQFEIRLFLRDTSGRYSDSEVYTLTFARDCRADLTRDGFIDFADYLEFLNFYDIGDTTVDYNNDGMVDFADYLEFLNLYDSGC
ncbi:MAG: hypothetical protein IT436_05680 [Phycisphaerales bacterium]|nr:hypothetical protein [Phycisphaerales bacterium]